MAAKSLKCGQCGVLLDSVKAAQAHGEVTGHSQFEETTDVIVVMRCCACGKPCRSEAERTLHSRHTGHTEFVQATLADGGINTEKEMKEVQAEMDLDDDLIKGHVKASAASGSQGGEGSSTGPMVSPAVEAALLTELESMGFGNNRAVRALYHTGGAGVEAAVNWMLEHEGDADIDEPLLVTQASEDAAAKLTPEERKRKAAELIRAAKERREREEKASAAQREKDRIRAGKEMQLAKKKEEEQAVKRMLELRQREKEEEAAARAKIQAQLEEDRKERRRRLGLPEELTEEEKAREAAKAAEKAATEEAKKEKVFGHVKPVSTIERLRNVLVAMKKTHAGEEDKWRTAAGTLSKYVANIAAAPDEDKFRNIKTTNAAFQQRVAGLTGSIEFLELCGFQKQDEVLTLPRDQVNKDVLEGAWTALNDMLTNPFFGAL